MPGRISNLEVFAAGTWKPATGGTVTFKEADLDEMAANFTELSGSNLVRPHLKLGHQDAQKWFGQTTGIPTLGWVERIWRDGKKLFADIRDVPDALLEMLRQGRYHNVSAEVYRPGQLEFGGKKLGHVLSAIAILGTEMPAVKDLAGLASALFADQFNSEAAVKPASYTSERNEPAMFTQEQVDSLVAAAVSVATGKASQKFADESSAIATELAVVKARAEAAESALSTHLSDAAQRDAVHVVDAAIKDGKLLPAQKDMALAFMTASPATIKFGGVEKPARVLFGEFIGALGPQISLKEKGSGAQKDDFASAAAEVDHLTRAKMASGKLDYAAAYEAIRAENPALMTRYAEGE